jgi:hypothetical protein
MDAPRAGSAHPYSTHPIDPSLVDDRSAPLIVDVRDSRGRRLLATVEPVEPTPAAEAIARQALSCLRRCFVFAEHQALADALTRAFETANREVRAANARAGYVGRHLLVGATAVATDGEELLVALASPGQAVVVQDGHLFAFPDLASWRPDFDPDAGQPGADPLGLSDAIAPAVYATTVAPGDAVLVGSTAVGRALAASPHLADLAANLSWLPAELNRYDGGDCQPGCAAWMSFDATSAPAPAPESPSRVAPIEETDFPDGEWISPGLRRAILRDRLHTKLIECYERVVPAIPAPALPLSAPRRATSPPGAGYVRCYRGAWRGEGSPFSSSHLSHGSRLPIRGRAIVAFLAIVLAFGGLYAAYDYRQAHASQIGSFLAVVDAHLAAITPGLAAPAVESQLRQAEAALDRAARDGASESLLLPRRAAITAVRDRTNHVTRLTSVARLVTLPEGIDRTSLHFMSDGRHLYLIADAVYVVDAQSHTLTLLLKPGADIAGRTVGAHLTGALDGDDVVVSDGRALYRLRPDGSWSASKLGSSGAHLDIGSMTGAAFNGSFYLLDAKAGEILKYPADQLAAPPEYWLRGERAPLPADPVDIVVDRGIYVLTAEGEIASYFRGVAAGSFRPEVEPPLADPIALVDGTETDALYLAETNGTDGRILRFERDGRDVRQLLLPPSWQADGMTEATDELAHVADIAVDEASGTVYFVGRNSIWRASIPPDETGR